MTISLINITEVNGDLFTHPLVQPDDLQAEVATKTDGIEKYEAWLESHGRPFERIPVNNELSAVYDVAYRLLETPKQEEEFVALRIA